MEIGPVGSFEERADGGETIVAEFESEKAAGFEMARRFRNQQAVEFVAFFAAEEGGGGLVVADFDGEGAGFFAANVGRIGNYEIERTWIGRREIRRWMCAKHGHDVSCPYIGEGGEEVGFEEGDARLEAEAGGVALGHGEGGEGNIGGVDFGGWEFFG